MTHTALNNTPAPIVRGIASDAITTDATANSLLALRDAGHILLDPATVPAPSLPKGRTKRTPKDQRDGESFTAWQNRLAVIREQQRARVAKHRAQSKQAVSDAATAAIVQRASDIRDAISGKDGVRGMDVLPLATQLDRAEAVERALLTSDAGRKLGARGKAEVLASLASHFNGFSKAQNKRASFLNTPDTPIEVMYERRKDALARVEATIRTLDAYRAMGAINRTRAVLTPSGTYAPAGIASDVLDVTAPAPVKLVSASTPKVITVSHAEVRNKDGRVTDRRKVDVLRVFGTPATAPAPSYPHTPCVGGGNMEVFTRTELMESANVKAERTAHERVDYRMVYDRDTEARYPREIRTTPAPSVNESIRYAPKQYRIQPAETARTPEGYLYTPATRVRPLVTLAERGIYPTTPKVTKHAVTLVAATAPIGRTPEGYAYSEYPRPIRTRVYMYVDAVTRETYRAMVRIAALWASVRFTPAPATRTATA
jgi:hypothetical protein